MINSEIYRKKLCGADDSVRKDITQIRSHQNILGSGQME